MDASAAPHVVEVRGLRSAVIGVPVARLQAPMEDLLPVLETLGPALSGVEWLYLVPLRDGSRLGDGAFSISADQVRHLLEAAANSDTVPTQNAEAESLMWALSTPLPLPDELRPVVAAWPLAPEPPVDLATRTAAVYAMLGPVATRRARIQAVGQGSSLAPYDAQRGRLTAELVPLIDELLATLTELEATAHRVVTDTAPERRTAAELLLAFARDARDALREEVDAHVDPQLGVFPDADLVALAVRRVTS